MDQNLKTDAVTLTKTLCGHLAAAQFRDLTDQAKAEARRGVLDWIGCALAGSGHRTITTLLSVLQETSGKPVATVFGRKLQLGLLDAPLANGQMGHVLDFDDTHMGGVVLHTSSPVLAALFALAERAPVSGEELMLAYAVGFEAGVRSGRTAPGHHKGGWHLTGTLGSIAAGAAAGKLLKLDAQKLTYAMGIAATQAAGMQQNRGTMCKSFHAGKAASNGVLAAMLAERGFDSTQEIIEGKKGFSRIYSDTAEPEALLAGLGRGWLIESNGHKPYACGVVLHPLIDAVIAIRNRDKIDPAQVSEIALRVNPLVLSITGVVDPTTGLQSKFSTLHSAAVALIDGHAGMAQYSDAKAVDPAVAALRRKVKPTADDTLRKDEAHAVITAAGQRHEAHIAHASGTAENRMSDAQIETKFMANASPVIGEERAKKAAAFVWALDKKPDVRELIALLA
ncbi:MmgE/PrpD family protein [Rhodoplanes sp. Z2-YC6860]|uniref:MmgE/PrpD family protein n=1 Tax=Rhodoplanes sp. Z2-YC6860 TaxID=674703 RepID=UPI00078DE295|nr:MmgE/PrpD family protein [Rhodoplanes sp. Z2-YC6860]AMN45122.1 MmgE/PrpD family protein [Rhodoplanes sp. Z2-YC6860]